MGCCSGREESKKDIDDKENNSSSPYKNAMKAQSNTSPSISIALAPEQKESVFSEDVELASDKNISILANLESPQAINSLSPSLLIELSPEQKISSDLMIQPNLNSNLMQEAESLNIKPLSYYQDTHAETLLSYSQNITTWGIPVKSLDWMIIEKLDKSDYNQDYPMTHTQVIFPKIIPLHVLLEQLNSPDHRPKWDSHVKYMEIISGNEFGEYYLYRNFSVALYKADFTDKKIVAIVDDSVVIIGYGVDGKRDPLNEYTRGITILSIHIIKNENDVTVLNNYSQTNANSAIAKAFAGLGPAKLLDWGKALIKRINSLQVLT